MRFLLGILPAVAALKCLEDGVPAFLRKNLTTTEGESYPVGMWVNGWASARLTSAMVQILIEEILGFNVTTAEGSDTASQMWAMAGCITPANPDDRGCGPDGPKKTYFHVSTESWTLGLGGTWNEIQRDFPGTAPVNLGNMGYEGTGGSYALAEVLEREPLLEFYGSYNASRYSASAYFDRIAAVNTSDLSPCTEIANTPIFDGERMQKYVEVTGDEDGVENQTGKLQAKCFGNYYWFPPVCRAEAAKCFLFLTSFGYNMDAMMQKATVFDIPLAVANVREWDTYARLPVNFKSLFYWWEPDTTFLGLNAKMILFPPYDRSGWSRGEKISAGQRISLDNLVSHDLELLAPEVRELADAFSLEMDVLQQLLLDQKTHGSSAMDAACVWLKENPKTWEQWLPDKTKCFPQFGLFDEATEVFPDNRDGDVSRLTCKACPSGSFSAPFRDNKGLTFICKECSPGYFQPSGASSECQPCPLGEHQEAQGAASCTRCIAGTYQDTTGQRLCKTCPGERSTLGLGSQSEAECVCKAEAIEMDGICIPCPEGVSCPKGSTTGGLLNGTVITIDGAEFQPPFIMPGYASDPTAPFTIYKCRDRGHCPGGVPGTCSGDRIGITCAECPAGSFASGGPCQPCTGSNNSIWLTVGIILLLVIIFPAYYVVIQPYSPKVRAFGVVISLAGLSLNLGQNWLVVSTAPTTWPSLMIDITNSLEVLTLDPESLGISCISSGGVVSTYIYKALLFTAVISLLLLTFALTRLLPKIIGCHFTPMKALSSVATCRFLPTIPAEVFRWTWHGTVCLIGKFCLVTFPTITNVGLSPTMCYRHPGGELWSLVQYSNTICSTSDHVVMLSVGIVLLVFIVGFLTLCIWASWKAPQFSLQGQAAVKFLFEDFRPDVAWFGLVTLFRGLFLSLPSVIVPNRPRIQMVLLHSTMLLSLVIQGYCKPWKAPVLNLVDVASQSLFLTLLGVGLAGLEPSDDAASVFEALGAGVCICLLVVLGIAMSVLLVALCAEKISKYTTLGQKCANVGHAPDPEVLTFLLWNLAGNIRKMKDDHRDALVAAMDTLGTHDARMILTALIILENELGLSAAAGSTAFQARDALAVSQLSKFSVSQRIASGVGLSAVAARRASRDAAKQMRRLSLNDIVKDAEPAEEPSSADADQDSISMASETSSEHVSPEQNQGDSEDVGNDEEDFDPEKLVSIYVK